MDKKVIIIFITCILAFSAIGFADNSDNPRAYDSIKVKLTQSGQMVTKDIRNLNISLYIPQENVISIVVTAEGANWGYIYDEYDNKIVFIEWEDADSIVTYKIETTVQNVVKPMYTEKPIGYDPVFVKGTDYIIIDDEIQKIAYPYENSLEGVSKLTEWVHNYMTYDLDYVGRDSTSTEILETKRGVCSAYSKLLAALLRSKNIPTKFVVGYAYSGVQKKFIPHAWNEVLTTEGWVPFDPTWLQGGFVDATHIKTGGMLDAESTTKVSYTRTSSLGYVDWSEVQGTFEILDHSTESPVKLDITAKRSLFSNSFGYAKVTLDSDKCLISEIKAVSCVDEISEPIFSFLYENRTIWSCEKQDVFFFFSQASSRQDYICPVTVFDQIGSTASVNVTVFDKGEHTSIHISGPDSVKIGEYFQIVSSEKEDNIFYSPEFGQHNDDTWDLKINKPGLYNFYLYSDGALAMKAIQAEQEKEFLLSLDMPKNITQYGTFIAHVDIRNLQNKEKTADIVFNLGNQKLSRVVPFTQGQQKRVSFNMTAQYLGEQEIKIHARSDALSTYTSSILVYRTDPEPQPSNILDGINDALSGFFSWLQSIF